MQAIQTRYHGPGNVRGSRVSATCGAGRAILEWDDTLNREQNHAAAARELARRLGWTEANGYPPAYCGGMTDGSCVFVFAQDCERL